ncbi:hypothetical protein PG993_008018 [Apiospora rasikravindrae]|uniref:Uncharacterized protein n=1 Tax=Apiospora rasikravindrae TaxID=990691 RepID=A0ABR1SZH7_9PEZI
MLYSQHNAMGFFLVTYVWAEKSVAVGGRFVPEYMTRLERVHPEVRSWWMDALQKKLPVSVATDQSLPQKQESFARLWRERDLANVSFLSSMLRRDCIEPLVATSVESPSRARATWTRNGSRKRGISFNHPRARATSGIVLRGDSDWFPSCSGSTPTHCRRSWEGPSDARALLSKAMPPKKTSPSTAVRNAIPMT